MAVTSGKHLNDSDFREASNQEEKGISFYEDLGTIESNPWAKKLKDLLVHQGLKRPWSRLTRKLTFGKALSKIS